MARHPGLVSALVERRHRYTAEQVIVSAHAYGSAKLLHHMRHEGTLTGLSDQLGQRARTNSEQLIWSRPYGAWKADPEQVHISPGIVAITSGVWPDPETSIEPVYYGVGSDLMALCSPTTSIGDQEHPTEHWLNTSSATPARSSGRGCPTLVGADGGDAVHADPGHVDRAVLERRHAA